MCVGNNNIMEIKKILFKDNESEEIKDRMTYFLNKTVIWQYANVQLNWKLLYLILVSVWGFSKSVEVVGYFSKYILHMRQVVMTDGTENLRNLIYQGGADKTRMTCLI